MEIREYHIPIWRLSRLDETVVIDRLPAGATILTQPRLTPDGFLAFSVSAPTEEPELAIEITLRDEDGNEVAIFPVLPCCGLVGLFVDISGLRS